LSKQPLMGTQDVPERWVVTGDRTIPEVPEERKVASFNRLSDIESHDISIYPYVDYGKVRLTIKEVRAIYDDLPPKDKQGVKALARKFVELTKKEKYTVPYTFDDGLMDVARLGVFICA
jgi:hypothetical protein